MTRHGQTLAARTFDSRASRAAIMISIEISGERAHISHMQNKIRYSVRAETHAGSTSGTAGRVKGERRVAGKD